MTLSHWFIYILPQRHVAGSLHATRRVAATYRLVCPGLNSTTGELPYGIIPGESRERENLSYFESYLITEETFSMAKLF